MREILGKDDPSGSFYVLDIDGKTRINFQRQVEDIIINSPDGDLFIGWDYNDPSEFTEMNSMLFTVKDNMKEITKERCTHFYVMPKEEGKKLRVYIATQR